MGNPGFTAFFLFFLYVSLPSMPLYMQSWDWTFDHLAAPVCEYLQLHLMEGFSGAIILLLGQLGRYCPIKSFYCFTYMCDLKLWLLLNYFLILMPNKMVRVQNFHICIIFQLCSPSILGFLFHDPKHLTSTSFLQAWSWCWRIRGLWC